MIGYKNARRHMAVQSTPKNSTEALKEYHRDRDCGCYNVHVSQRIFGEILANGSIDLTINDDSPVGVAVSQHRHCIVDTDHHKYITDQVENGNQK